MHRRSIDLSLDLAFFYKVIFSILLVSTSPILLWLSLFLLIQNDSNGSGGGVYAFIALPAAIIAMLLGVLSSTWATLGHLLNEHKLKIVAQLVAVALGLAFFPLLFLLFPGAVTNALQVFFIGTLLLALLAWVSIHFSLLGHRTPRHLIDRWHLAKGSLPLLGMMVAALFAAFALVTVLVTSAIDPGSAFHFILVLLPLWISYGAFTGVVALRAWQLSQRRHWPRILSALTTGLAAALTGAFSTALHLCMVLYTPFLATTIISACVLIAVFTIHALLYGKYYPTRRPSQRAKDTLSSDSTEPSHSAEPSRVLAQFLTQKSTSEH